jgi:hypothetical protein
VPERAAPQPVAVDVGKQIHRRRRAQEPPPRQRPGGGEQGVRRERRPEGRLPPQPSAPRRVVERHQAGERLDEVRELVQEPPLLRHRLPVAGEIERLEIAKPAVDHPQAVPGRLAAEVPALEEQGREPAPGRLQRQRDAMNPAAHHEQVVGARGRGPEVPVDHRVHGESAAAVLSVGAARLGAGVEGRRR